ncbi:MAG: putative Co/Zn/Cd efflux system membrane fusion protein [Candidatus Jettenia ecosi]|uniref:Putative Co/Zn/Cd efflux system membrane fusion protein n=1 Tax=Candidatus Jettenia ecosi TaxID=2494326 RepID=A0A533QA59_9BACT|nr:MAG: putative Co/Zn/Cd efflux system membrane fusion protein [Candidatus Jettenia ecosi]
MSFKQKFLYSTHFLILLPIVFILLFSTYIPHTAETDCHKSLQDVSDLIPSVYAEEAEKEVKGEAKEKKILYWTCGMHPSVKMDKPGKCPICAMDLIPVYEKGTGVEEGGAVATVELGERARALAQVKTDVVSFRSLTKDIYTVGLIEYDERLKATVAAWVPSRIDRLFVDFTGTQVIKGEAMVWIYSPDLVSTQEEYLLALETAEKTRDSTFDEIIQGGKSLLEASKRRLLWWGLTEKQIEELAKEKKVRQHTIIYAPVSGIVTEKKALEGQYVMQGDVIYTIANLSNVWTMANIYEYEMSWVKVGQEIEITTPTYPGEAFIGKITFVEPFLDDKTRSVKIRCDIPNPQFKLKPAMYVNTRIRVPIEELTKENNAYVSGLDYFCPNHSEIKSSRPGICPEDNVPFVKRPPIQAEPAAVVAFAEQQGEVEYEYVCPMKCHSAKEPGDCPVCGMKLERKEIPIEVSGEKLTCICPQEWDTTKAPESCPMCGMMLQTTVTITTPTGEEKQKFVYMCPMACMTSDRPGECDQCKRPMGQWEMKDGLGIKVKKAEFKKRVVYDCPMHLEIISDKPEECPKCGMRLEKATQVLAIPATAVLDTGIRKIVYLDKGNGQYAGKEVILGPKAGDYYPVLDGLEEDDKVVTTANFLIDSQSQLTGGASALYGGAMEFKEHEH